MNVVKLLDESPRFHTAGEQQQLVSHGLSSDTLQYLDRCLQDGAATLETGAGMSTVVFASRGARHTCITPDQAEVERIGAYCDQHGISMDRVRFVVDRSEVALPRLDLPELDFVLIDGRHAFPTPFIDWYYVADRLRVGGRLVLDDTQVWTVAVLRDFLLREEAWQLDADMSRSVAFVKTQPDGHEKWFGEQLYVMQHSPEESGRLGLDAAFSAYRRRDKPEGDRVLLDLLREHPEQVADPAVLSIELVRRIVDAAATERLDDTGTLELAESLCGQLPDALAPRKVRRHTLAGLHEWLAFRDLRADSRQPARGHAMRAMILTPRRLANRGMLSVMARSIVGSEIFDRLHPGRDES